MTSIHRTLLAVGMLFAAFLAACSRSSSGSSQWYFLRFEKLSDVAGTSALTPDELAKAVAGTDLIRIDNVRTPNGGGKWYVSEPPFTGTVFVRPQSVTSFEPMDGPPKDIDPKDAK